MSRIVLVGADGQLGFELLRALAPLGEVVPTTVSGRLGGGAPCLALDMATPGAAAALVAEQQPAVVVNAAAYTAVDKAEDETALARRINAEAVAELAKACLRIDARLIHYSTDYVFDGREHRPQRELDRASPLNVYGWTKLDGEHAIAASGVHYQIFRTAWVYAARGNNFLRTMLRLAAERDELRVVADQVGSPTPARWLAGLTALVLARADAPAGLWHAVAGGQTSWHGLAEAIVEDAVAAGLLRHRPRVVPIATADYPTLARRPAYSCLDCGRLDRDFGLRLPPWRQGVREVVAELVGMA